MPDDLSNSDTSYQHRPKPFSNPLEMVIRGGVLHAQRGTREQDYPLDQVERLRLTYTPKNTQRLCFTADLRLRDGRSLTFTSLDWRSMVENARQDVEYTAFVRALASEVARRSPRALLLAGLTPMRRAFTLLGAGIIAPALLFGAGYAAARSSWLVGAAMLGLLAWMAFYLGEILTRNRPAAFTAGAIPPGVLPPETAPRG